MTSGIFVWGIEQTLLALVAFGIVTSWQSVATTSVATADCWVTFVLLFSCCATLVVQSGIAFSSKRDVVSQPTDDGATNIDLSFLYNAVAQAHCCVVVLIGISYIFIFFVSLYDLVWVTAFFPSAPGLLFATGSGSIAFLFVMFFISMASVWACTPVGDSNYLFFYHPLFMMVCVVYPVLHEIGQHGLIICSKPVVTTLTFMYVNLTIASSFALHCMEIYEFDPAHVFPAFMHSIAGQRPLFRVYSLLHGLSIIIPFLGYASVNPSVSVEIVIVISLLAFVSTVLQSLNFHVLFRSYGKEQTSSDMKSNDSMFTESVIGRDTVNNHDEDPKVKKLRGMNWFEKPKAASQHSVQQFKDADTKQLRIDFMRVSKNENNFVRKRG
jgi:hypothetical protein